MDEDQLEAIEDLIRSIAYEETGHATHQQRTKGIVADARNRVRAAFGLPIVEDQESENGGE